MEALFSTPCEATAIVKLQGKKWKWILGSKITVDGDCSHEIKSFLLFSSSHVWMWELDQKEGWTPKNWCF